MQIEFMDYFLVFQQESETCINLIEKEKEKKAI